MEAWLEERRRAESAGAAAGGGGGGSGSGNHPGTLRRRTVSSSSSSVVTQRAGSAYSGSTSSSSVNRGARSAPDGDWEGAPLSPAVVEYKEAAEEVCEEEEMMGRHQQEEEKQGSEEGRAVSMVRSLSGGRTRGAAFCFHSVACGVVGATLSWYCWGLAFFAPLGPSKNITQPEIARWSHTLSPGTFYALQAGRLVGAPLFGHLGDRNGRRVAFALSVALVGVATTAMGCFYPLRLNGQGHGAGVRAAWAALRFLLGMGVAGQCAGNLLVPMESCATEKGGAVAAAVGHIGLPLGLALAAVAAHVCLLEEERSWRFPEGLRLAHLAGVLLLPVALWAFAAEEEAAPFKEMEEAGEKERWPLLAVLRTRGLGLLGGAVAIALDCFVKASVVYYWPILLPHALGHGGIHVHGCLALALLGMAGVTLLSAAARERLLARCVIFRAGAALAAVALAAWARLAHRHEPRALLVGYLLVLSLGLGTMHGAMDALLVEPFPTAVAYTGSGLLYQATNALVHTLYPSLAYWLLGLSERSHIRAFCLAPGVNAMGHVVAGFLLAALAIVGVYSLKAYHKPPTLGRPRSLLVRECIELSGSAPIESLVVVQSHPSPESSIPSSETSPPKPTEQRRQPPPLVEQSMAL